MYLCPQDDGDYGVGRCILGLMAEMSMNNMVIFVIRDVGGIHLGPRHFDMIAELYLPSALCLQVVYN